MKSYFIRNFHKATNLDRWLNSLKKENVDQIKREIARLRLVDLTEEHHVPHSQFYACQWTPDWLPTAHLE